ncbi:MAG: hypothetical protein ACRD3S_13635 [Terracidiphilus sp.]
MPSLLVKIVRFVDETQPGVVACEFLDAHDHRHTLIDKIPMFSELDLWTDSAYPQPGAARCQMLERLHGESGQEFLRITIKRPDHLETVEGKSEFVVFKSQITDDSMP